MQTGNDRGRGKGGCVPKGGNCTCDITETDNHSSSLSRAIVDCLPKALDQIGRSSLIVKNDQDMRSQQVLFSLLLNVLAGHSVGMGRLNVGSIGIDIQNIAQQFDNTWSKSLRCRSVAVMSRSRRLRKWLARE
jgi:hypothetical protein